mmetsp:Transcript_52869/g.172045  ORF Transcript_52869/g.172045 Transcript_52869/m.172045 type:complete len:136 (-) Transcript_52869:186-593(-)
MCTGIVVRWTSLERRTLSIMQKVSDNAYSILAVIHRLAACRKLRTLISSRHLREALQVLQAFGEVEEELEEYLMSELESLGVEVQFSGGPEDVESDEIEPDYSGFEFRETNEESSELAPGEMRFLGMAETDAEAK